jgi:hypothetical protein
MSARSSQAAHRKVSENPLDFRGQLILSSFVCLLGLCELALVLLSGGRCCCVHGLKIVTKPIELDLRGVELLGQCLALLYDECQCHFVLPLDLLQVLAAAFCFVAASCTAFLAAEAAVATSSRRESI